MDPDLDTVPPSGPDTEPCPVLAEHEPFCVVRPVTFLPTFDLSADELDDA